MAVCCCGVATSDECVAVVKVKEVRCSVVAASKECVVVLKVREVGTFFHCGHILARRTSVLQWCRCGVAASEKWVVVV